MALGEAIKVALGDRKQTWLAKAIEVDDSRVSRIISGEVPGHTVTLGFVVKVEDALELGRGDLLRAAGFVEGDVTLAGAVASDPSLTPDQRRALRAVMQLWKE